MIRIALCDDNITFCSELEGYILDYAQEHSIDISVEVYSSGEYLIHDFENLIYYDLIFLDIRMQGCKMSGIEIGTILRTKLNLYSVEIIFLSSCSGYAMELFQFQPMDFLIKPVKRERIYKLLEQYINRSYVFRKAFSYMSGGSEYKFFLKDIIFFKSNKREVIMYLANGDIKTFYSTMNEIILKLENLKGNFFSPHNSFVVNYYHIIEFHHDYLILTNKYKIPVSRNKHEELLALHIKCECKKNT